MHTNNPAIPYSTVPGIVWPAVPGAEAARVLALLQQFEYSQWWEPARLWERQWLQIQSLLRHARTTTRAYPEAFAVAGLAPRDVLAQTDWRELPLLRRADLQRRFADLLSNRVPPDHGRVAQDQTSGSTGQPVRYATTALASLFWRALSLRDHVWHDRDLSGRLALIRAVAKDWALPPSGAERAAWGPTTDGVFQTGSAGMLTIEADVDVQLDWLVRRNPDYLLTYPTNLRALVQQSVARGLCLPQLRAVRTVSEVLDADIRHLVGETWGVPIQDCYSSREVGHIAVQCPMHDHYHVQSESVLVEVLDARGRPCEPGEVGRVVVTALHNFALPLIRYEIGDYAEVGAPCPCGRGLPVLTRILGRSRNMLTLPNGSRHWPRFGYSKFGDIAPIRQLQLVQHSLEDIEARLVVETALNPAQEAHLAAHLQNSLGYPFRIRFTYLDNIPRSANGKYEDVLSLIEPSGSVG